jgi:hypothetical protein
MSVISTNNNLDRLSRLGDHSALGKLERVMDVGGWLWRLALEHEEAVFRENRIDNTVLPGLAAEDLKVESDRCCMR